MAVRTTRLGLRLGALLVASVLPLAVLSSGFAWLASDTARGAALRAHYESARVYASDAETFLEGLSQTMLATLGSGRAEANAANCGAALTPLLVRQPSLLSATVLTGESIICTLPQGAQSPNASPPFRDRSTIVFFPGSIAVLEMTRVLHEHPLMPAILVRTTLDPIWERLAQSAEGADYTLYLLTEEGGTVAGPAGTPDPADEDAIFTALEALTESGQRIAAVDVADVGFVSIARVGATSLRVAAIGPDELPQLSPWLLLVAPALFLIAAVAVAWLGVDVLVSRWVRRLKLAADRYGTGDMTARVGSVQGAPTEIQALAYAFDEMAANIQARSVDLEDALTERGHFVRELHHRVKNNFQMIASLLSLQRREADQPLGDAIREALDRVQALATAYRASYAESEHGAVPAATMVRELLDRLRENTGVPARLVSFTDRAQGAELDLDRAIPFALLATEILAPALGRALARGEPVSVRMERGDGDTLVLRILHPAAPPDGPVGLAARLIPAYSGQLRATVSTAGTETTVRLPPPGPAEVGMAAALPELRLEPQPAPEPEPAK